MQLWSRVVNTNNPPLKNLSIPLALVAALMVQTLSARAQELAPKFTIKDTEATTGSKFKRDVVTSNNIPLNLPYEKLNDFQKGILKSPYELMGPDDEPPFPLNGLAAILTEMSEAQKILQVRGKFTLHAARCTLHAARRSRL
jgi:hypothetical protein